MDETPDDFVEPGLPRFSWDEYAWVARDRLPSWAGFQSRGGAYGAKDRRTPSDGAMQVSIRTRRDRPTAPHPSQVAAYRWLKEHEADVARAILDAAFRIYPGARAEWLRHYPDEASSLPILADPKDLAQVMGLHDVHVLAVEKDGFAYVGFEFGCNWEDEHGFGVLTYKDRVIDSGSARTAFQPSSAMTQDGGKMLGTP